MKSILFALLLFSGTAFAQEDRLIAILKSDAPLKDKADACQELARVATRASVPVLSTLLADDRLSHRARFALEPIPDPSADAALRQALTQVKGPLLVGVIHSLGVRRDPHAVAPITPFLTANDPVVAPAAARALGRIGGTALPALEAALSSASPVVLPAVCDGMFRCAETMPAANAAAIYDQVRALPNLPHHLVVAAVGGAIRSRGAQGMPLLVEAIRTGSPVSAAEAMGIAMDLPGAEVTRALVEALEQARTEDQIAVLQSLGVRGDLTAADALTSFARRGPVQCRVAAIESLVQLRPPSSIPTLAGLVKDAEPTVTAAAWEGLTALPGREADAAVVALMNEPDGNTRVAAIGAASQRRITSAVPALIRGAGTADTKVASASFKALGELAGAAEIPAVVKALAETRAFDAAETALIAICERQPDPAACVDPLLSGLATTTGDAKLVLLSALGSVGGPRALNAMRAAATDPDESIRDAAFRALCDWPTADALPDLGRMTRTGADSKLRNLALRGQLRLIPLQTSTTTPAQRAAQIQELLPVIEQLNAQHLALSTLAGLPCPEALALVQPFLTRTGFKAEAGVAAVAIAEKIVTDHPTEVAAAMAKVQSTDAPLAERIRQVQAKIPSGNGVKH